MNNIGTQYAEYLNYISRNEPTRKVMTLAEFREAYDLSDTAPIKLIGVADPMHY